MSLTTSHPEANISTTNDQVIILPKANTINNNHHLNTSKNTESPLYLLVMKLPTGDIVQLGTSETALLPNAAAGTALPKTHPSNNNIIPTDKNDPFYSSQTSQSSLLDAAKSPSALNAIKLTTKLVRKTVHDVLSDSSQSLTWEDSQSRNSSQSETSLETIMDVPRAKPGRKSKSAPDEDPSQKKIRSLERNRAAAMRCREKRKNAMKDLKKNVDELQRINDKLQAEFVAMRRKVSELKNALLAHKDCPVAFDQKNGHS